MLKLPQEKIDEIIRLIAEEWGPSGIAKKEGVSVGTASWYRIKYAKEIKKLKESVVIENKPRKEYKFIGWDKCKCGELFKLEDNFCFKCFSKHNATKKVE